MRQTNDVMAPLDDRRPTILKEGWTKSSQSSFEENSDPESSVDVMKEPDSDSFENQNRRQGNIKKRVQFCLSDNRRKSLTGSLPDLAKSPDDNYTKKSSTDQTEQLELNIKREPLPVGSDVFRAVMSEIDSEEGSSTENLSDSLNKSWSFGQNRSKSSSSSQKVKFQSKAAAAIYAKMHPFQSSPVDKTNAQYNTNGQKKSTSSANIHSDLVSPRSADKRTPCTRQPSVKSANKSNYGDASPLSPGRHQSTSSVSSAKLSPLVSGEIREVRISSEKIGVRRQLSTSAAVDSPRISSRRSTSHRKLTKSASLDV